MSDADALLKNAAFVVALLSAVGCFFYELKSEDEGVLKSLLISSAVFLGVYFLFMFFVVVALIVLIVAFVLLVAGVIGGS